MAASHRGPGEFPHTRDEIVDAMKDFVRVSGTSYLEAQVIFISPEMEAVIDQWTVDQLGWDMDKMRSPKLRCHTLFGLKTVFDAPVFTLAAISQTRKGTIREDELSLVKCALALAYYYGMEMPGVTFHPAF